MDKVCRHTSQDHRLTQAVAVVDVAAPEVTAALDQLGAELPGMASQLEPQLRRAAVTVRRRRRRRQRILLGVASLAVVGFAAPAAAGYVDLHTGFFGTEGGHRGEYLRLDSPDNVAVAKRFEAQYPLPPGGSWAGLENRMRSFPAGLGQKGVFEETVGGESRCQWERAWLSADDRGDTAATAAPLLPDLHLRFGAVSEPRYARGVRLTSPTGHLESPTGTRALRQGRRTRRRRQ